MSSFKEGVLKLKQDFQLILDILNSEVSGDLKVKDYKMILNLIRDEIHSFNFINSEFSTLASSSLDFTNTLARLSNIELNTKYMMYNSKTINPNIDIEVPSEFTNLSVNDSIVKIKTLANVTETELNKVNDEFNSFNLTQYSEVFDNFIKNFNVSYFENKVNVDYPSSYKSTSDKLKLIIDNMKMANDLIIKNFYFSDHLAYYVENRFKENPQQIKYNGIANELRNINYQLNNFKIEIGLFLTNADNVYNIWNAFIANIELLISKHKSYSDIEKEEAKANILGLYKVKEEISDLKNKLVTVKTATPLTTQLLNNNFSIEFRDNFRKLRRISIRTYDKIENDIIILCTKFVQDNDIAISDTDNPHHALFGSDFFGGLNKNFRLVDDEDDLYTIRLIYSSLTFEKFYSTIVYYVTTNKKYQIEFNLDDLYATVKNIIMSEAYSLRSVFSEFINESKINFYERNTGSTIVDISKKATDLCFYTLNSAAPQGVSNSHIEYNQVITKLDDLEIKDVKFSEYKVNLGSSYTFNVKLKDVIFGLNSNKSSNLEFEIDIVIALKNNLSPVISYISPSYMGSSLVFGYGNLDTLNTPGFFISCENITEIKLKYFKVNGSDINDFYVFLDHELYDTSPLKQGKSLVKLEKYEVTDKHCLNKTKPINGLHEFGILELYALAHDPKYAEMTIDELVEAGVSGLVLSNLYYYVNGINENGIMELVDPNNSIQNIKSDYLLKFSNTLTPMISNWVDIELYQISQTQIDEIIFDFCSVYVNSVFDSLVNNHLKYEELIAYNSEYILESRLENQIYKTIKVNNDNILQQIYNNDYLPIIKMEFRSICREFISSVFDIGQISNKEKDAKDQISKTFSNLYKDCLIIFEQMLTELNKPRIELAIANVFDVVFKLNLESIVIKYSDYGLSDVDFQINFEDSLDDIEPLLKNFYKLYDVELQPREILNHYLYTSLLSRCHSAISIMLKTRV